ncbi:leucine-rich repeat protein [Reichenbachiella sp.]|uniref:leucine-rich repeat protein n=1 Tax=Reichenbachiella sp. TaxID=2184521 RepID=UPI003BB18D4C
MFIPNPNFRAFMLLFVILSFFLTQASAQYILTDDDVTMSYGRIASCSYNFEEKNIIIPQTLDGETVIGIVNKGSGQLGVFDSKGITSVQLPATMEYVGDRAFIGNEITSVSFTGNVALERIGEYSFAYNSISAIDLTGCPNLKMIDEAAFRNNSFTNLSIAHGSLEVIEHHAFRNCGISSLDLDNCPNLQLIGNYAFQGNAIETVSFVNSTSLHILGAYSFADNSLSGFDLSQFTSFVQLREYAFNGNTNITSVTLPAPQDAQFENWVDESGNIVDHTQPVSDLTIMYSAVIPYTLTDEDVVMENNWIRGASFDRRYTHIIIPPVLDGQPVEYIYNQGPGTYSNLNNFGVVGNRNLVSIKLPSSMKYVGINSFVNNPLIELDLSECQSLNSMASQAFYNHKMTEVDLSQCTSLTFIESLALHSVTMTSYTLPKPSTPDYTFNYWYEGSNSGSPHDGEASTTQKYRIDRTWNPDIKFVVVNQMDEPIEGVQVVFEGYESIQTNADGIATFENTPAGGSFDYEVTKLNHTSEIKTFISDQNTSQRQIDVVLTQTAYSVTFTIQDKEDAVSGAEVTLTGYGEISTDDNGVAFFPTVDPEEDLEYTIIADGYENKTGSFSVSDSDVNEQVQLDLITYDVTFEVTNGDTAIDGAVVSLAGYSDHVTGADGKTVISDVVPEEDLTYTIEADTYDTEQGTISISDANLNVEASLVLSVYSISFVVTDGQIPIEGGVVVLTVLGEATTNAEGLAVIEGVLPSEAIGFQVTADGFDPFNGEVAVVNQDVEENVQLTAAILEVPELIEQTMEIYPNPAGSELHLKGKVGANLEIYTLSGNLLSKERIVRPQQIIELDSFPDGYYLLKIENHVRRLVIIH